MSSKKKNNSSLAKTSSEPSNDFRIKTTSKIWSFATGMLAICIPLSAATESGPILPISVICGATVGTVVVWKSKTEASAHRQASEKIKELEGRIADLETIITAEDIHWKYSLEPSSPRAVLSRTESRTEAQEKTRSISESGDSPS